MIYTLDVNEYPNRCVKGFYLWSVLGKNADELVSCMTVSSVEQSRPNVLRSVRHLCQTRQKKSVVAHGEEARRQI